jgi:hypothetical protein
MMKIRNVPCSRWWQWHPPVGVFIAILAVVGVVVPWFKGEHASRTERAIWSVGMFLCMGLEIRSIYLAQAQHDEEQERARSEQLENFRLIADGINTNLVTATDTFNQTRPRADVKFETYVFDPLNPLTLHPNTPIGLNFRYKNMGNDVATNIRKLGWLYVASTDHSEAMSVILPLFNAAWEDKKTKVTAGMVLVPGESSAEDFHLSGFSVAEANDMAAKKNTIYMLFRVEYTDATGTWVSEHCDVVTQINPTRNQAVQSHCSFFNSHRRPSE